jgi:hypothetical protein
MIGPLWIRLTHISRSLLRLDSFIEWSHHLALCSPSSKKNFTPLWLVLFAGAGQITEASYFFCMGLHPLIAFRLCALVPNAGCFFPEFSEVGWFILGVSPRIYSL